MNSAVLRMDTRVEMDEKETLEMGDAADGNHGNGKFLRAAEW